MFDIFCSHKLVENPNMPIMFRCGQRKIEYNPSLVQRRPHTVESLLKNEIFRILMKHPYERVPQDPNRAALKVSSDITVNSIARYTTYLKGAGYYNLDYDLSYEEYYKELKDIIKDEEDAGTQAQKQATELWTQDEEMKTLIDEKIFNAGQTNNWGTIPGNMIEKILPNKNVKMNYKKILMMFRTSMISSIRSLTRLKPNRRYDFDYMGSRYKPSINLLIAVDSSGSISGKDLAKFFAIINKIFKYGTKNIKVLVFDTNITQELDFKRAQKEIEIIGRGGTDFQAVIDYYKNTDKYDGMIIFTDGYASPPVITFKKRIVWILNNKENFDANQYWLKSLPGKSTTWIPDAV